MDPVPTLQGKTNGSTRVQRTSPKRMKTILAVAFTSQSDWYSFGHEGIIAANDLELLRGGQADADPIMTLVNSRLVQTPTNRPALLLNWPEAGRIESPTSYLSRFASCFLDFINS
jgi:hypothetical protein